MQLTYTSLMMLLMVLHFVVSFTQRLLHQLGLLLWITLSQVYTDTIDVLLEADHIGIRMKGAGIVVSMIDVALERLLVIDFVN